MSAALKEAIDNVREVARRERFSLRNNHDDAQILVDDIRFDLSNFVRNQAYYVETMNTHEASDYATLDGGDYGFYYGYETADKDENGEEGPWKFQVKRDSVVLWSKTADELGVDKHLHFNCAIVLLSGIGKWLDAIKPRMDELR